MRFLSFGPAAWILVLLAAPAALFACSSTAQSPPFQLEPGQFTALGGVRKSSRPTASDLSDMQAAENGALNQPALVEFYADN